MEQSASRWLGQFSSGGAASRYQGSPDVESRPHLDAPRAAPQQRRGTNVHVSMTDETFRQAWGCSETGNNLSGLTSACCRTMMHLLPATVLPTYGQHKKYAN